MTGASGSGPRLDTDIILVDPLEVVPLIENESVISSEDDFETHLAHWIILEKDYLKFKDFMRLKYDFPKRQEVKIAAPLSAIIAHKKVVATTKVSVKKKVKR
jgi:hypothetical protein